MTNLPTVSCIVPAYNSAQHLPDSLESILAQSHRPHEVIVADDGSTDGTADVLAEYAGRVSWMRQDNGGPAAARNLGLSAATGEFVAFLDADDRWESDKLERQLAVFDARPVVDLCFTAFRYFWAPELEVESRQYRDQGLARPIRSCHISSLLIRRETFAAYGKFDPGLRQGENTTWLIRAKQRGARVELLPDVLLLRRIHPASVTRRDTPETLDAFLGIIRTWRDSKRTPSEEQ